MTESGATANRVVLVEARTLVRRGLASCLGAQPDFAVVAAIAHPGEVLRLPDRRAETVVVGALDQLPAVGQRASGGAAIDTVLGWLSWLAFQTGAGRLVALAPAGDWRLHDALVEAGVCVVPERCDLGVLVGVVRAGVPRSLDESDDPNELSVRELEVLRLVALGHTAREIAALVDITTKTVENHKQRLFRKLEVQNQAHAVAEAVRRGLLAPHGATVARPA